jgi:hypothetical protein
MANNEQYGIRRITPDPNQIPNLAPLLLEENNDLPFGDEPNIIERPRLDSVGGKRKNNKK